MQINTIYNSSCQLMNDLPDGSVDLVVTSPPYYNLKSYSSWPTYKDHLDFISEIIKECYRVLRPGGWICWNIQEYLPNPPKDKSEERTGTLPLLADTICIMRDLGFFYEKDIIWYKGKGTATQKMFGTYPNPGLILISGLTEHIITARKQKGDFKKVVTDEIKSKSIISKKEWADWAVDLWDIQPVNSKKLAHPAPFPIELPYRLIRLYSFVGDLVLDPFMGSGQTALAAKSCGRNYVGYEMNYEYYQNALSRIKSDIDIGEDYDAIK